jgi:hypothetical protein
VAGSAKKNVGAAVYTFAGLRIVSDFPLNELPICCDNAAVQDKVVIRRAPVPAALPSVAARFPNSQYNGKELLLDFPEVGRFLLRGSNEILVDPTSSSNDCEVGAYLLGTAFGALCHQRGIPPLHASAIDVANGCVAFVGETGAGKSTIAAVLAQRGHQMICDDVCVLQLDDEEHVWAWPGSPRLRLWEDAMTALRCDGPAVEREMRGWNKYLVSVRPPRNPAEPRRLRGVFQLHAAPHGAAASVSRVHGAASVEVLMQNVYRLGLAEYMGFKPAAFVVCAAAARDVPVFRFSRPMGFDVLDEGIGLLEDHMRDMF